ncbi:MAG: EAL domain-containing protein [Candidatus Thiodiazotropha sp.]
MLITLQHVIQTGVFIVAVLMMLFSPQARSADNWRSRTPLDSVVLQLKWKHQYQFAGYYVAQEQGYYRDEGLDVEIREHTGEQSPIEHLMQGDVNFAVTSANVVLQRAKGHPVVALAAIYQHSPYALLVRADSNIRSASDLAGRRIMFGSGTQDSALHAMLKRAGVKDTDYTRLPSSFDALSLMRGETDAFNAYQTDQGFLLQEMGVEPYFIKPRDYGIDFYGDVLVTREGEIREHPRRVERFLRASLKGWAHALEQVDETIDLILEKYNTQGMSRAHLRYEAEASRALIESMLVEIGYMNPERWAHIQSVFVELGVLGPNSNIEGMIYEPPSPVPTWVVWIAEHTIILVLALLALCLMMLAWMNVHMRHQVRLRSAELEQQEYRYRTIFNAAPEGLWLINPKRKTVDANKRLLALLGYDLDEMLGKTPMDFVDAENRTIFQEQMSRISTTDRRTYEIALRHRDGHNIATRFSAVTLRRQDRSVVASIAFVEDITERKRLEAELRTGEQNLRRLINAQPACVSTFGADGRLLSINPKGLEIFQAEALEEIRDSFSSRLIDPAYRKEFDLLNISVFQGHSGHFTFSAIGCQGRQIWLEMHSVPIMDAQGEVIEHLGLTHDVTDRLRMEMQILEEREFLQSVIDNISDSVMVIDPSLQIQLMNKRVKSVLQKFEVEAGRIKHFFDLPYVKKPATGEAPEVCPVLEVLETGRQATAIVTSPVSSRSNKHNRVEVIASPLLNQDGSIRGVIEVARDITEHLELLDEVKQQKDDLEHLAHHDSLTNLPNRVLFLLRLKQAISKAKRTERQMAVLFVDLDRFKEINDTLGHAVGDRVLKEVAERFRSCVREEDLIARLGGDEFVFLTEGLERPQHAAAMAQQIIQSLSLPFTMVNQQFFLTASIGISIYPQDGKTAEMLLRNADAAMYKAKEEGKNTFQYYTEDMTEQAFERIFLETSLRRALETQQLVVYYQPQVEMSRDQVIGVEALVRWVNPEMGLVAPSRFIPLAEDTGLIIPLGEQVVRMACEQMVKWEAQGIRPRYMSINLSVKQVENHSLIPALQDILEQTGCRPEWLEFEVTEGSLVKDPDKSGAVLQQLRDLGFELAIDDFGTGYSSLAYLKRFPLTRLKIDQSFIRDVPDDADDKAITRAIIALAKSLNLRVLAEGVEQEEQKQFLVEEGCFEAQGYYFGHPYSETEMTRLLQNSARLQKAAQGPGQPTGYSA